MLIAVAILAVPMFVSAAEVKMSDKVNAKDNPKNLYTAGENATIDAAISGDLVVAGGTVIVNGDVENGVIAAGGDVTINGFVGQSIRVAGGNVTIKGNVGSDLVVFGGTVVLDSNSTIDGDVIVYAGSLNIKGQIVGDIKNSSVGNVIISGTVAGKADLGEINTLKIEKGAEIGGMLTYSAQSKGIISDDAIVGEVKYTQSAGPSTEGLGFQIDWLGVLLGMIGMAATCLLFVVLMPVFTKNVVNNLVINPWANLGIGLGTVLVTPVVLLITLIITLFSLGISFGIFGYIGLIYVAFLSLSGTITALAVGSFVWKYLKKESDLSINWKTALVGVVIVTFVNSIPYIGFIGSIATSIVSLMIFGVLTIMAFSFLKQQRTV